MPSHLDPPDYVVLLEAARNGDSEAFKELMEPHHERLIRFFELRTPSMLRARVDADDLLQNTQVVVLKRLARFIERQPMPFRIWLYKCAGEQLREAKIMHLQREKRAAVREQGLPDRSSVLLASQLTSPSNAMNRKERNAALARIISQLSEVDREVLLLRHIEGFTLAEIGKLNDISPDAARKRYGRALVRLREMCEANGIESFN